ncbi:SusC/RagA family TonB-linked outer membrane protein [Mucilaginibacter sp.]|jgi:TonB-linked SusC/RagA family outer membrane protein|uniref:SusC/RagA family TonB-linked outer membrane protein n=1 Tax=Mucilaginibacter sp. TaxID=1882438 RepID=UPI00356AEF0E
MKLNAFTKVMPNAWLLKKFLLVMKLTTLLLVITLVQVSAKGYSQKINLNERNVPLEKVLHSIEQQSGYVFFYDSKDVKQLVNVKVTNASIEDALATCFKDIPLTYKIADKTILLQEKEPSLLDKLKTIIAVPSIIKGKVLDENGQPLMGATIRIKGKNTGMVTNDKGEFEIAIEGSPVVLTISYISYIPQEITVSAANTNFVIHLMHSTSKLDEVQVIAYGETTQRYNVGSVSKVTAADISSQPVTNVLSALEGRVPGLVVSQTSGIPGASFNIQIRGQNTLSSQALGITDPRPLDNPFFIIDGVPFATQNPVINQLTSISSEGTSSVSGNPYGGMSPFNSINPADIESIEILRDADATAIYGSRAANGVILITTKKGKAGKVKFSANIFTGQSRITRSINMMNTSEYLKMRHEAISNDGLNALLDQPKYAATFADLKVYDTTKYTDWKKYFLGGTAYSTDANASVSGGTTNTQFLIGGGYHRETYIFPGDFSDNRASLNSSIHHSSADKRLNIDFSVNYSYDQNNSSGTPSALKAYTLPPDSPDLLDASGNLVWKYNGVAISNPLAYLKQLYNAQNYNLLGHFQVGYELLPGLSIRASLGYNTVNFNEYSEDPSIAHDPSKNILGSANFARNDFMNWIIEPQAEYKKMIGKGKLDILIGGSFQKNTNTSINTYGSNYSDDALLGSISGAGTTVSTDGYSAYKYDAIFGRINYIWDGKYIVNVTGRRDGSSRFGPGKQFGNFGSIGGGWIFSEEQLIKKALPVLSYGKVRATYGTTGNDRIGDYQYLSNWAPNGYAYQGQASYVPLNLFNQDYSWEINKKLEAGLELGFLKDGILFSASWYRNRCGNQLVTYSLPTQTGFYGVIQNFPAVVQNTGWEFQLNANILKTDKFSWNTSINVTIPRNKLLAFPGLSSSSYATTYIVGQPVRVLQRTVFAGVNDTTGVFQFLTSKGAKTYQPDQVADAKPIGTLDPKFYGGFRNTFSYKQFQLDIFLQFAKQRGPSYLQQIYQNGPVGSMKNQPELMSERWQHPGDQAIFEKFTMLAGSAAGKAANSFIFSDAAYTDASYLRFKTVSFSYTFSNEFLKKMNVTGCRLFINAQNLFTVTKYIGDPESQSIYNVPPLRTIAAGLQFTF